MGATAQINVRIDASAKQAGDGAIAAANLSPSEVVRAVWDVCAHYRDSPAQLRSWLFPQEESEQERARARERKRRAQRIEEGANMFEEFCKQYGADAPGSGFAFSDNELEALDLYDSYGAEANMSYEELLELTRA